MSSFIDDLAGAIKGVFSHEKKGKDYEVLNQYEDDPVSQYVPPVEKNNVCETPLETYALHENENIDNVASKTIQTEEPMNETEIDIPIESVLKEDEKNKDETEPIIGIPVESVLKEEAGKEMSLCLKGNGDILKLFTSLSDLINEFDTYLLQTQNEETKQMIEVFQYRLIESLEANGAIPIDKDTEFDCLKHVPVPFSIVQDGMPIKEILRIGLKYNGSVILKARVRL